MSRNVRSPVCVAPSFFKLSFPSLLPKFSFPSFPFQCSNAPAPLHRTDPLPSYRYRSLSLTYSLLPLPPLPLPNPPIILPPHPPLFLPLSLPSLTLSLTLLPLCPYNFSLSFALSRSPLADQSPVLSLPQLLRRLATPTLFAPRHFLCTILPPSTLLAHPTVASSR